MFIKQKEEIRFYAQFWSAEERKRKEDNFIKGVLKMYDKCTKNASIVPAELMKEVITIHRRQA